MILWAVNIFKLHGHAVSEHLSITWRMTCGLLPTWGRVSAGWVQVGCVTAKTVRVCADGGPLSIEEA